MGRLFLMHLEGNAYSCKFCRAHLGLAADIISKNFQSKHGKAYLFNRVHGGECISLSGLTNEKQLVLSCNLVNADFLCNSFGNIQLADIDFLCNY
ncbi:protein yippee-like [Hordeum vulgare]|nr:protein yippee-like [Hordeum vulgare]